jgi:signal peptidase I
MRTSALDRRVRKEARILVREARAASQQGPQERAALAEAAREVEDGLAAGDLARVRRGLPRLDELALELPRMRRSMALEYAWAFGSLLALVLSIRAFVVEAFKIPSSSMLPTLEINDHIFVTKFIYGLRVPLVDGKLFARSPSRGEVIVFIQPCEQRDFIKRVIGLAGDRIEVRCGVLHVNGEAAPGGHVADERCKLGDEGSPSELGWCTRYHETLGGLAYDTFYDPELPPRGAEPPAGAARRHDFPDGLLRACRSPNQRPGTVAPTRPVEIARPGPCGPHQHYVVPDGHVFVMGDNRDGSRDSREWGSVPIENIKGKALVRWLSYRDFTWSGMRWSRIGSFVH